MLACILKEHQAKQAALKQSAAVHHKQLDASVDQLGLALEQACDALVSPAQLAQSQIERESQILSENVAKFARQTAKWASVIGSFNEALKVTPLASPVGSSNPSALSCCFPGARRFPKLVPSHRMRHEVNS